MKLPPILKNNPLDTLRYEVRIIGPCLAIAYIQKQYRKTHDERLIEANSYFCDKLRSAVLDTVKDDSRRKRLLLEAEELEQKI